MAGAWFSSKGKGRPVAQRCGTVILPTVGTKGTYIRYRGRIQVRHRPQQEAFVPGRLGIVADIAGWFGFIDSCGNVSHGLSQVG